MSLLDFNEVSSGMEKFDQHPDVMAAWEARNYVRLESVLRGLAMAITRTVMERLANPLEKDTLETFKEMARKADLATTIANSVGSWQLTAPMLGN